MMRRRFIAHRGVHLDSSIAGENSLESVELARRAGFACIETDVRSSVDGELVVMHDATINRTAVRADGTVLSEPVVVAETTLAELRTDYLLQVRDPQRRSHIPTLEEYLRACAQAGLTPFIEFKLDDQPVAVFQQVLDVADATIGRGGYVMTSNREVNRTIRGLGITDVLLMDILHQAPSFDDVATLGDVIVAISATRHNRVEHLAHVTRAKRLGLATESHADDVLSFAVADEHGVDLISTDVLAPDLADDARIVMSFELVEGDFRRNGSATAHAQLPSTFGGMFLQIELEGACEVRLGPHDFELESDERHMFRHQVMVSGPRARFAIIAGPDCRVHSLRLTVAEY